MKSHNSPFVISTLIILSCLLYLPPASPAVHTGLTAVFSNLQLYTREHLFICLLPLLLLYGAVTVYLPQDRLLLQFTPSPSGGRRRGALVSAALFNPLLTFSRPATLSLLTAVKINAGNGSAVALFYGITSTNLISIVFTIQVLGVPFGLTRLVSTVSIALIAGIFTNIFFAGKPSANRPPYKSPADPAETQPLFPPLLLILLTCISIAVASLAQHDLRSSYFPVTTSHLHIALAVLSTVIVFLLYLGFNLPLLWLAILSLVPAAAWYISPGNLPVITGLSSLSLGILLYFHKEKGRQWISHSLAQLETSMAAVLIGVAAATLLVGNAYLQYLLDHGGFLSLPGQGSFINCLAGALAGAVFIIFPLSEIPIADLFMQKGINSGILLSLTLAGPAICLPNLILFGRIFGTAKTIFYACSVLLLSTSAGYLFDIYLQLFTP